VVVAYGPPGRAGLPVAVDGDALPCEAVAADEESADIEVDGVRHRFRVSSHGERHWVNGDGWQSELEEVPRFADTGADSAEHGPTAPVPGTVVAVAAVAGAKVGPGDLLVVLEAMKMEHRILAGSAGLVRRVLVAAGDRVDAHQLLVEIEPVDPDAG
jgi:propionyl-CoA carboxylase alpha chain